MSTSTARPVQQSQAAKLLVRKDGELVAEYNLNKRRVTIGRKHDCDIRLDCKNASRHHAQIFTVLRDDYVLDLDSMNGTYVNRNRIKKHTLETGDIITIGSYQLKYVKPGSDDTP
ncbi:MAG: FHA domain-containing protein [Pseudomonadota bacterium]